MYHDASMNPRIGTAGWSVPKPFAAEAPAAGTHLERYARILPCAEINSSFYRPHRIATWAKWAAAVPEDFRFAVKAPKAITHETKLANAAAPLKTFLAEVSTLATRLGPILFQLPPSLAFDAATAERFLTTLRDLHPGPAVFEPRHPTWFTAQADALFNRFHIARAAADPAKFPEAAIPGGWSRLVYYRLHGSPRTYYSAYTEAFLHTLAAAIAPHHLHAETELWCVFDNTALGAAFNNALILSRLLTAT